MSPVCPAPTAIPEVGEPSSWAMEYFPALSSAMYLYMIYTQPPPFSSCHSNNSQEQERTVRCWSSVYCLKSSSSFPLIERQEGKHELPATWVWPTDHDRALKSFVAEMKESVNPRSLFLFLQLTSVSNVSHFAVFHFYSTTHRSIAQSCTNVAHFFCGPLITLHRAVAWQCCWPGETLKKSVQWSKAFYCCW